MVDGEERRTLSVRRFSLERAHDVVRSLGDGPKWLARQRSFRCNRQLSTINLQLELRGNSREPVTLAPFVGRIVACDAIRIGRFALLVALVEFAPVKNDEGERDGQRDQPRDQPKVLRKD